MTETPDLTVLTPPEVDGQLADLSGQAAQIEMTIVSSLNHAHYLAGDKRVGHGRYEVQQWQMTEADVRAADVKSWNARSFEEALAKVEEGRIELARIRGEINVRNEEWARRGYWSRFFLVRNNGGHIHSSMDCSTCNKLGKPTKFGWLPALSGLTEKDAVDAHGTILCTVCYPTAPVEWTVGAAPKHDYCSGSNANVARDPKSSVWRPWALCPECGKATNLTANSGLRKHKAKGA